MDNKLIILYKENQYSVTFMPSSTVIFINDEAKIHELVTTFIDSHEIDKEVNNVL